MKRLTKSEEEIMLVLWKIGEGVVRDVMAGLRQEDIPYTTVSTVIRILEKKGFIGHRAIGTTHLYFPAISKQEYLKGYLSGMVRKYFNGSFSSMASFFARENDLSLEDLKEMMSEVEDDLKNNKGNE